MIDLDDVGMSVNLYEYFSALNVAMGGWFGVALMIMTYFAVFSLIDRGDSTDANIQTLFVVLMLSALLWGLEWISLATAIVPLALFLFSLGYKIYNS